LVAAAAAAAADGAAAAAAAAAADEQDKAELVASSDVNAVLAGIDDVIASASGGASSI